MSHRNIEIVLRGEMEEIIYRPSLTSTGKGKPRWRKQASRCMPPLKFYTEPLICFYNFWLA